MSYEIVTREAGNFIAKDDRDEEYSIQAWDQFSLVKALGAIEPQIQHHRRLYMFCGKEIDFVSPGHLRIVGAFGDTNLASDDPLAWPYDDWLKMVEDG